MRIQVSTHVFFLIFLPIISMICGDILGGVVKIYEKVRSGISVSVLVSMTCGVSVETMWLGTSHPLTLNALALLSLQCCISSSPSRTAFFVQNR